MRSKGIDPTSTGIIERESEDFSAAIRTVFPDTRYEDSEAFERQIRSLIEFANAQFCNERIRERVKSMIEYYAQAIRDGEEVTQLGQAAVARELGIAKSSLNEDIGRLRKSKLQGMQDASEEGTKS